MPATPRNIKDLIVKYGKIAFIVHISISTLTFLAFFALLNAGVDLPSLLAKVGYKLEVSNNHSLAATAIAAFVAQKLTSPPRILLTISITPFIAKWFGYRDNQDNAQNQPHTD
eukprot:TRINITY_DN3360_c0_g1_i1.p2 TRINITY_DN3360_c0_g1~~TRINITY_DN3360_c0_g1_i1.p2  ORF type:complete len:113 (-),score=25.40 TRINITY_DN3360_c0_g1_i1:135-473(-)